MKEDASITVPLDTLANLATGECSNPKAKIIFSLLAIGVKEESIAKMMGLTVVTIKDYINKYDKDGLILDAIVARRYFMAATFETIATNIAGSITQADLDKLSPRQKVEVAEKCIKIASMINPKIPERSPDIDGAFEKLGEVGNGISK